MTLSLSRKLTSSVACLGALFAAGLTFLCMGRAYAAVQVANSSLFAAVVPAFGGFSAQTPLGASNEPVLVLCSTIAPAGSDDTAMFVASYSTAAARLTTAGVDSFGAAFSGVHGANVPIAPIGPGVRVGTGAAAANQLRVRNDNAFVVTVRVKQVW